MWLVTYCVRLLKAINMFKVLGNSTSLFAWSCVTMRFKSDLHIILLPEESRGRSHEVRLADFLKFFLTFCLRQYYFFYLGCAIKKWLPGGVGSQNNNCLCLQAVIVLTDINLIDRRTRLTRKTGFLHAVFTNVSILWNVKNACQY